MSESSSFTIETRAQAERLRYGVDHSLIGGVVLRRWRIARDLDVAPSTVRSHVHSARAKLGAKSRARAVLIATRHGWV
jgi:DNA-binding CsgD family transcriptional regulator